MDDHRPALRWRKQGLIFRPADQTTWARGYASVPTPVQIEGSLYRVYFAARDERQRSHVGYFDIDLDRPDRIESVSPAPVLRPGALGRFDDHGIYASSAVWHGSELFLYTIGWNPGVRSPLFYSSIGLAVSRDGGCTFERASAPIMARSEHDPCLVTAPTVLKEGDRWRMWYVSGLEWVEGSTGLHSRYHVKYATSNDGITWHRDGTVCLDFAAPEETNIARTWVMRAGSAYRAWYAYDRGKGYRIGYATSSDGLTWCRADDRTGIDLSPEGWDSEAQAYPAVLLHGGRAFMFYNGNAFGRDGVGLAVADDGPA